MNLINVFFFGETLGMSQIADIVISEAHNPWIHIIHILTSFTSYSGHQGVHAVKVVLCYISAKEPFMYYVNTFSDIFGPLSSI